MTIPDERPELVDIPAFLRRNPDNSVPDVRPDTPPPAATVKPSSEPKPEIVDHRSHPVQAERRAAIEAQKKAKAYARVGKLKAVKADREALAAGKTWDPIKAKWV